MQERKLIRESRQDKKYKSQWDSFEFSVTDEKGHTYTGMDLRDDWELYLARKKILIDKVVTEESVEDFESAVRNVVNRDNAIDAAEADI